MSIQTISIIFIHFLLFLNTSALKNINDFKKNYFNVFSANQGFHNVTTGFEEIVNQTIIFNGFINNDLYVDIVTLTKDKKKINFYLFDEKSGIFMNKVKEF